MKRIIFILIILLGLTGCNNESIYSDEILLDYITDSNIEYDYIIKKDDCAYIFFQQGKELKIYLFEGKRNNQYVVSYNGGVYDNYIRGGYRDGSFAFYVVNETVLNNASYYTVELYGNSEIKHYKFEKEKQAYVVENDKFKPETPPTIRFYDINYNLIDLQ